MEIEISTPLLFPAVSLLLLAYTNRFLAVAQLIRLLHRQNAERDNCDEYLQIENLKHLGTDQMDASFLAYSPFFYALFLCFNFFRLS